MCRYKWEKIAGPRFRKYEGETVFEIIERKENDE